MTGVFEDTGIYEDEVAEVKTSASKKPKPAKQPKNGKAGNIQKAIKLLQLAKDDDLTDDKAWEADKDACRGKLALIFPFFEKIIADHDITKQGNNAKLFRRVLNLRV